MVDILNEIGRVDIDVRFLLRRAGFDVLDFRVTPGLITLPGWVDGTLKTKDITIHWDPVTGESTYTNSAHGLSTQMNRFTLQGHPDYFEPCSCGCGYNTNRTHPRIRPRPKVLPPFFDKK